MLKIVSIAFILGLIACKNKDNAFNNMIKCQMLDLIKISSVFLIILILLRKKIHVGIVMLVASVAVIFFYKMSFYSIKLTVMNFISDPVTIKLTFALSFIRMFELILREQNVLSNMMETIKNIFRNKKIVTVSMPLLIGLVPSVGGAYFSAPMVDEATRNTNISAEEKGFINYWFRHPWEYILPLYPGILLASAITKIELHNLIIANLVYAVLIVITGFLFAMHNLKGSTISEKKFSLKGLWSFMPLIAVLLLVVIFHVELHYTLIGIVVFLLIFYRYNLRDILRVIKHGFSLDMILLIVGVMFFKEVMENSGAVKLLSSFFLQKGIPVLPLIFVLPFVTGILTGLTLGFVGSTFPLIVSISGQSIGAISFAFSAGFIGVLLSPVHICLVLTREYFKADIGGIYKMMAPGCLIIFAASIIQYFLRH